MSIEGDPGVADFRGPSVPEGRGQLRAADACRRAQTNVKYRAPYADELEELDLETAMDMIADRVWDARERTFDEERDGLPLDAVPGIAHLGGATLDNEENYLIKKLFAGGLGMVCDQQSGPDMT